MTVALSPEELDPDLRGRLRAPGPVDRRLLVLLLHLAERFGRAVPNGAVVPALSPELLSALLQEPAPVIEGELAKLVGNGTLARRANGSYLLSDGGPDADRLRVLAEAARRTAGSHRAQAQRLQQEAFHLLADSHPRVLHSPTKARVLLVSAASSLATVVRAVGHDVTTVANGEEALAALTNRPHVVVVDAASAIVDELAFVDRLRTVPRGRGARVVLLVDPAGRRLPSPGLVALAHARATTLISPQRFLRLVEEQLAIAGARVVARPRGLHAELRADAREA